MPIAFVLPEIFPGIIAIWSGLLISIPTGWALCNGTQGTPDLRNRFVICYGDTYDVGDRGGGTTHSHLVTIAGHTHWLPKTGPVGWEPSPEYDKFLDIWDDSGNTNPVLNVPPYYAFAYIMKL